MFKVKGQRSQGQRSRSRRKVMYQQQKRYNTAMDKFSDVKLGMASELERERAFVARAAQSCNAFLIATFSSWIMGWLCNRKKVSSASPLSRRDQRSISTSLVSLPPGTHSGEHVFRAFTRFL